MKVSGPTCRLLLALACLPVPALASSTFETGVTHGCDRALAATAAPERHGHPESTDCRDAREEGNDGRGARLPVPDDRGVAVAPPVVPVDERPEPPVAREPSILLLIGLAVAAGVGRDGGVSPLAARRQRQ